MTDLVRARASVVELVHLATGARKWALLVEIEGLPDRMMDAVSEHEAHAMLDDFERLVAENAGEETEIVRGVPEGATPGDPPGGAEHQEAIPTCDPPRPPEYPFALTNTVEQEEQASWADREPGDPDSDA